jgi:hypothetical protein
VERPKILHNDATGKYVMWMHIDSSSYGEAKAGVATSDTVCGNYTYMYDLFVMGSYVVKN